MRFKHALACPRPVHLSPQVQPIITTPLHGTYPMGHAVQAYLVAYALQKIKGWADASLGTEQLQSLAGRISINRVVAGVHFPMDAHAGQALGHTLGQYFVAASQLSNGPVRWDPCLLLTPLPHDFDPSPQAVVNGTRHKAPALKIIPELARLAAAEWS
jgi:hypothetical protein